MASNGSSNGDFSLPINDLPPSIPTLKTEKDVSVLLAKELNRLSINEREDIFERIHGVHQVVDETEQLIETSLVGLQTEIDRISPKKAYEMAISSGSEQKSYIESRKFRLLFLRCENFDTLKAAKRLIMYHERILEYFGPQVLGRPLCYTDLDKDSQEFLKSGIFQTIQSFDSVGRKTLFFNFIEHEKFNIYRFRKPTLVWLQVQIYLICCMLENDPTAQRKGILIMCYMVSETLTGEFNDGEAYGKGCELIHWMPVKVAALHICYANAIMRMIVPIAWLVMGKKLRQIVRIHDGSHIECMFELQSYGVPVDSLPVTFDGKMKNYVFFKWLAKRQGVEKVMKQSNEPLDVIVYPAPNDVALWRGAVYRTHPGNVRMRQLIEDNMEEYDKTPKRQKYEISLKVIKTIQTQYMGRFLTQQQDSLKGISGSVGGGGIDDTTDDTTSWWVEVSAQEAQKRVSKAFRSARKPKSSSLPSSSSSCAAAASLVSNIGMLNGKGRSKRLRLDNDSGALSSVSMSASRSTRFKDDRDAKCACLPRIIIPPRPEHDYDLSG